MVTDTTAVISDTMRAPINIYANEISYAECCFHEHYDYGAYLRESYGPLT